MPKARLPNHSNTHTGPEEIGAALDERWRDIDRRAIETAKTMLDALYHSIARPIFEAADEEVLNERERISPDEAGTLAVALRGRIAQPVVHIDMLCGEIWMHDQEEVLRAIERQEKLADYSFGRPLSNEARGRRLQEAVEMCAECLRTPPNPYAAPHAPIIFKLATICFEQILSELRRLRILGVCRYCDKTIFPAVATKLYCSPRFEGRNCSQRQSSKTYDAKRRTPKS